MKAMISFCALMAAAVCGTLYAADAPAQKSVSQQKDTRFTIVVPSGWTAQKDIAGVDAMYLAPPASNGGGSQANVNVISGELDKNLGLAEFFDVNMTGLPKELDRFSEEETGSTKIDGIETKWVRYTHHVGDLEIRVLQYFFVVNGKGYVVTFSALGDVYKDYESAFADIIKTFKINAKS